MLEAGLFQRGFYMAKESETSSAVKKKKAAKKKTTSQKTTRKITAAAAKKTKSTVKKTAAKKTAAKKTTRKTTAKKNATAKSPKAAASATKKFSPKEILFMKFNSWTPETPFSVSFPSSEPSFHTAPPFFEGKDDSEKQRLGGLLLKKFDYETILSEGLAAMKKAEEEARKKAEEEAKKKAEEEAKKKAEEEARKKAEEEARKKAEEEAKKKAEEEARKKAEEEARKKAEEKSKMQAMMQKAEETRLAEAARKAEEERIANLTTGDKISIAMKESKPMNKTMMYAGAFFAFIFAMLIFASTSNVNNYYLKTTDTGVEIWKGKFAPLGEKLILAMPGIKAPETIKSSYTKDEVYPLAFEYYIDQAKSLLDQPGIPDFETIKTKFEESLDYATLAQQRKIVKNHLTTIDLIILTYKADVFAGGGTSEDYQKALDYLGEATKLDLNEQQINLVKDKMTAYISAAKTTIVAETGEEDAAEEIDKLYSWKNVRRQEGETVVADETTEKEAVVAPQQKTVEETAEEKIENMEDELTPETPADH
jgi:hypothetical protein